MDQAQASLNTIRTSIEQFATSRGAFKAQVLQRIAEINAMIPEIIARIKVLKEQVREVDDLKRANERLTREKNELVTQVENLTAENKRLQGQIEVLNQQIEALNQQLSRLQATLNELQTRVDQLQQEVNYSRQANAELQRQLDESKQELANIRQKIDQLTNQLIQCNQEKEKIEITNRTILAELEDKTAQLTQANQLLNTKQQELNNLIQEIQATAAAVAKVLAENQEIDDPEMTRQLDALRGQFIELMNQLEMNTDRFGQPPIPPQGQPPIPPQGQPPIPQGQPPIPQGQPPIQPITIDEKRQIFNKLSNSQFPVPLPNQLPNTFAELKKKPQLRQRLIDLLNISQNFYDDSGNITYNMNQITRDNLTEFEYTNFRGLYGDYLNYWGLNPPGTRGGGKLKKRKTQKKQYKHKYMKGGWVYKGDPRLDSESTVISESRSRSGSKTRSKSKSKSVNKRKSIRKLKNKGLITRKRNRNRK
jgi:predicted nuclease with TOPRIM domain